jgi:hypothetical protein
VPQLQVVAPDQTNGDGSVTVAEYEQQLRDANLLHHHYVQYGDELAGAAWAVSATRLSRLAVR